MRAPITIPLVGILLGGCLVTAADATVYWTAEDAERARQSTPPGEEILLPPSEGARDRFAYLDDFVAATWFIASLQVTDSLDPEYGGIREGEHLLDVIQTDNTSESIWMFSRYFELTGDSAILPHLAASWVYVNNHPAYDEEGTSFPEFGYYRYYNCGWAVRAGMKYEQVFGDVAHKAYVDSCASYLATHTLQITGDAGFDDQVNPPVLAWGAGNLRRYAVVEADSLWKAKAWNKGQRVKGWVDADPTILGNEIWAMSGGAVMWGLLESYFDEFPGEEAAWVSAHVAEMDTVANTGTFENAWHGWYALGEKRLQESTGDPIWGDRHQALTDYLLAFDTDSDGGIMAKAADADSMDQTWITSYLGFMGLQALLDEATSTPWPRLATGPDAVRLAPNRPNPFRGDTDLPFQLTRTAHVTLDVMDVAGRRVARLVDRDLAAGAHTFRWDGRDALGRIAASGTYFYRVRADGVSVVRKMVRVR